MYSECKFEDHPDILKARCLRFASALDDVMDGMSDHDIQGETGLQQQDCDRIAKARSDARTLVVAITIGE